MRQHQIRHTTTPKTGPSSPETPRRPALVFLRQSSTKRAWSPLLFLVAAVALCQVVTQVLALPRWLAPSPADVAAVFLATPTLLLDHAAATLIETALGFALAFVVGALAALWLDASAWARQTIYPLLVVSQTVPIIAIAPILVIWFGYGLLPKVLVVALVCFFPIVVGWFDGLRSVDRDLVDMARSLGADRWRTLWRLRAPLALPGLFSGVRIAVTYSVIGAIVGEWVGASKGLGVLMIRSIDQFLTDRVFAAIIVCSIVSVALFWSVGALERICLPWRPRASDNPAHSQTA